ncbi:hypothetical protein PoB_006638200, partial [Plakobranchus ocellatus]
MASKFVVYIAVVCVSLIAFCTVESCLFDYDDCKLGKRTYRHAANHVVNLKNGSCQMLYCYDGDWSHVYYGCYIFYGCFHDGEEEEGRKCSDGVWIPKRGEI